MDEESWRDNTSNTELSVLVKLVRPSQMSKEKLIDEGIGDNCVSLRCLPN